MHAWDDVEGKAMQRGREGEGVEFVGSLGQVEEEDALELAVAI